MNALVMYVGHSVFNANLPFAWKIGKMNTHAWMLFENFWRVGVWCAVGYILHRKKTYLSL